MLIPLEGSGLASAGSPAGAVAAESAVAGAAAGEPIATTTPRVAVLSLYEGDILNRIWSKMRLGPRRPIHILHRALILVAITWIPMAVLTVADPGLPLTRQVNAGNFFGDFAAYAQFWLGLPLFVLAEAIISVSTRSASLEFAYSGVVRARDLPRLDALQRRFNRAQRSPWSDAGCLAIGYALAIAVLAGALGKSQSPHPWYLGARHWPMSWPGTWEFIVALPLLNYWWLRHIWKVLLWWLYLRAMSRFRLDLVASHPDATGGIGFVSTVQGHFAWLLLAYGVTNVAATVGYKLGIEHASVWSPPVWGPVVGFIVGAPLLFLLPLFMFTRQLYRAKRSARRLYRRRVMEQARLFESEVLPKSALESATLPGAIDLSLMAQFSKLFEASQQMRVVPFDWRSVSQLVGATFSPIATILPALHVGGSLPVFVSFAQKVAAFFGQIPH